MYNMVTLVGRMVNPAEISVSKKNLKIAKFRFAVDLPKKMRTQEKTADFFRCTAFGSTADCIEQYTGKGSKLLVQGRLSSGSYVDKKGQRVYYTEIIVHEFEFLDSKKFRKEPEELEIYDGDAELAINEAELGEYEEYEIAYEYDDYSDGVSF